MQSVGLPKSLDTNLNTAGSEIELRHSEQPQLRKALSDNFGQTLQRDNDNDNDDNEQLDGIGELSQPSVEEPPKIKARSRFSSAFRSFRGAKFSKKKLAPPLADVVLSSGGEELDVPPADAADVKKKKTKLSKKFSLSGIKRNKVNPKKEELQPSGILVSCSTQTTQTLDRRPLFSAGDEPKRNIVVTAPNTPPTPNTQSPESSPTKFDKVRKIQITIQGKKIEHTSNKHAQQTRKNLPTTTTEITGTAPTTSANDEGEYLTAVEEPPQQKPPGPFRRSLKKKQKSKSKPNSPTSPPPKSLTSGTSTTITTEEKFVVTQSICDTPPRERAPAKPSRAPTTVTPTTTPTTTSTTTTATFSTTVTPPTTTGAIRKSLSHQHQLPKLRRQRLHVADSTDTESNFMIREGTVERGRRFPRPSSIDGHDLPSLIAQSQSLPAPFGTPESLLPPRPTTAEAEVKSLPPFIEETQEPQETANQPREPTSLPTLTSSIVSTLEIENLPNTNTTATTTEAPKPEPDPEPASASQFTGNNIQNPNLSGSINDHPPEDNNDNDNSLEDPPTVSEKSHSIHFAVGTPVRPQRTSVILSQVTLDSKDFSSFGSNKSSGSDHSRVSESSIHRRKIKYIDQQTIYTEEERDILDGKREANYLSGISEYSFDSEFSGDPPMPAFGDLTMDQEDPPIMTSSTEKREHLYKILVIGELGTGKTSFIKRYVHQFFSQNYRATIGVDFALKVLHWDSNTIVRLQLWDIAGQERFGNMTRVYYKEAVGAFIVFDVTRSGTFDCVSKWKEDLDSKVQLPDGSPIPCILLANKCDQDKQGIVTTPEKMDEYVRENGFAGWYETSAKENINIDEAARALVNKILLNDKLISAADIADSEKFNLSNSSNGGQSTTQSIKSKCSC